MERDVTYPLIPSHFKVVLKKPSGDGLVPCACWNTHTVLGWKRCHYLTVILTVFPVIAILVSYIVAIAKQAMPAFLPFISQAAGHPPMNGLFTVPMIIGAFIGFIIAILFRESINQRNVNNDRKLRIVNNMAFMVVVVAFLGFIVTGTFPVGYTDVPNKFEWIVTVLFEHSTGASMILIGAGFFHFLMTAMWYWLPDASKKMRYFRMFISVIYIILFLLTVKPMPDYIREELGPRGVDFEYMKTIKYELPVVFSVNYIICAFSEWMVCILALVNFIALYGDMKRVSFRVILRHKSCFTDTIEPAPSITFKA